MKLGPWHLASVKPVHVGWYETKLHDRRSYDRAYWDGKQWKWAVETLGGCMFQHRIWRGILE